MKNLKRVLSLALTGVMLMGMMAIGASAANKDFTDADEIVNVEAVDVMSTLGVLKGKDTGAFDPKATVTRAEMAKIICVMLNGGVDPTLGSASSVMFSDIQNHWAKSYIQYCANLGIIAGQGDGTFAPDAPVTGAAAAKMLLVALGYDSDIAGYKGVDWELNVNRDANKAKLYDGIKGIDTSAGLSRDNTAQMAYNTLEAKIMERTDNKVVSSGEISYSYEQSKDTSFLNEYFDAHTFIGTFVGNKDTGKATVAGHIQVLGRLDSESELKSDGTKNERPATFPYDLDIANIGEEVKVIFKDGKSGTKNTPDKNDSIYGVFNTGRTTVYNVTKGDIQDSESTSKLKFGGVKYDIDTKNGVDVTYNYNDNNKSNISDQKDASKIQDALKKQSPDTIKFVADEEGKIYAAYVVEYGMGKVTAVTSSKITISTVGAIDLEGNDVYDGAAKNDVVVYTQFYNDKIDDATFTVAKAETVEGTLNGYKSSDNVKVGGETYKIGFNKTLKTNLTDDAVSLSELNNKLNEEVTLYMVGNMVGAIDAPDSSVSNYALITGTNGGKAGADYDALNVKVRMPDGTTAKYDVHEDSTSDADGKNKIKDNENTIFGANGANLPLLVRYTMSGSEMKIREVATTGATTTVDALWNKTTKALAYDGGKTAVASNDAVLFAQVESKYYNYDLRSLGNIKEKVTVQYFMKDGRIVAAYAPLSVKPGSLTADTLYGMVTGYNGTNKDSDDTIYQSYTVWVGKEVEVLIDEDEKKTTDAKLATGNIVTFDEANDGKYVIGDFTVISAYDEDKKVYTHTPMKDKDNNEFTMVVAVDTYNNNTLTYFTGTNDTAEKGSFVGTKGKSASITVDADVVIVYVDADEQEKGVDNGVASFDTTTGNANALLHLDSDGVVDAIVVETSGKYSFDKDFDKTATPEKPEETTPFTITCKDISCTKTAAVAGYSVTAGTVSKDNKVTLTVKATDDIIDTTNGETVTITYNDGSEKTETVNFAVGAKANETQTVEITLAGNATVSKIEAAPKA